MTMNARSFPFEVFDLEKKAQPILPRYFLPRTVRERALKRPQQVKRCTRIIASHPDEGTNGPKFAKLLNGADSRTPKHLLRLWPQIPKRVRHVVLTILLSGPPRCPLRTGEHTIYCEHGAAIDDSRPLQRVVRQLPHASTPGRPTHLDDISTHGPRPSHARRQGEPDRFRWRR